MKDFTRKIGEHLRIGDRIVVTILAIRDRKVRLKISTPESVAVWREESFQQLKGTSEGEPMFEICTWLGQTVSGEPEKAM